MSVYPPLAVRTYRGPFLETESMVLASVSAAAASDCVSFGRDTTPFPARSIVKPFQALPLLSGGNDVGALTPEEIALACGSHNGEDGHAQVVSSWLTRMGLTADALLCPPSLPMTDATRDAYIAQGGLADRRRNDCSGKHCGFLAVTVAAGREASNYLKLDGYVQAQVMEALRETLRCRLGFDDFASDGCGAPTPCVPLTALARGWRALSVAQGADPLARAVGAIRQAPWYLAGTGRFDSEVVDQSGGAIIAKVGAAGLHAACLIGEDVGVAVKALDGSRSAAQAALSHILREILGIGRDGRIPALDHSGTTNDVGQPVGLVTVK